MNDTVIKSPKVFGILSLSFAGIIFFYGIISLATNACMSAMFASFNSAVKNDAQGVTGFTTHFLTLYNLLPFDL